MNGIDGVVDQAIVNRIRLKMDAVKTTYSASIGSEPKIAVSILTHGIHLRLGKTVLNGIGGETLSCQIRRGERDDSEEKDEGFFHGITGLEPG